MSTSQNADLALHLKRCFVAYDSRTGDVLHVHEFLSEQGPCGGPEHVWDAEAVRQMAARDFESRALKVVEVPRGMEPREGYCYRVDLNSGTLIEVERPTRRFRDFIREQPADAPKRAGRYGTARR
jgi:hypothetical protein